MALMLPSLTLPVHPLNSLDERLIGGDIKPVSFKINRHMQELELWTVERNTAFTDIGTIIALIETDMGSSLPTFSPSTALLDFTAERIAPTDSTAFVTKFNAYMSELQTYASANFAAFTQLNSIVSAIASEYSLTLPSLTVPYSMTLTAEQLVIGDDDEFITKMKAYMAKLQRWERENNEALIALSAIFVSLTVETSISLSGSGSTLTGSSETFTVTDSAPLTGRKYRLSINGVVKQTITVPETVFTITGLPTNGSTITRLLEIWDNDNLATLQSITDTVTASGSTDFIASVVSNLTTTSVRLSAEFQAGAPARICYYPTGSPGSVLYSAPETSSIYGVSVANGGAGVHQQTITGLTQGVAYTYVIQSSTDAGASWFNASGALTFTTVAVVAGSYPPSQSTYPTSAMASISAPALGVFVSADLPNFEIGRVSNDLEIGSYSSRLAITADNAYVLLPDGSSVVVRSATTGANLKTIAGVNTELTADHNDADKFWGVSGGKIRRGSISAGTVVEHMDAGASNLMGQYEGAISVSGNTRIVASNGNVMKVYDTVTLTLVGTHTTSGTLNGLKISHDGQYVCYVDGGTLFVANADFSGIKNTGLNSYHGDTGVDMNGNQVFVKFAATNGVIEIVNMATGGVTSRSIGGSTSYTGHVSCRNSGRDGWAYLSLYNETRIFALRLDLSGPLVIEDWGRHRAVDVAEAAANGDYYYKTAKASSSVDGTQVLITSEWLKSTARRSYILRYNQPASLPTGTAWLPALGRPAQTSITMPTTTGGIVTIPNAAGRSGGNTVIQCLSSSGWRHDYALSSPENSDGTLLALHNPGLHSGGDTTNYQDIIVNATTLALVRNMGYSLGAHRRWSSTDPDTLYTFGLSNIGDAQNKLFAYHPSTNIFEVVFDFTALGYTKENGYLTSFGQNGGAPDWQDKYCPVTVAKASAPKVAIMMVIDLPNKSIHSQINWNTIGTRQAVNIPSGNSVIGTSIPDYDGEQGNFTLSKDGNYCIVGRGGNYTDEWHSMWEVYNRSDWSNRREVGALRSNGTTWATYHISHAQTGVDLQGNQVLILENQPDRGAYIRLDDLTFTDYPHAAFGHPTVSKALPGYVCSSGYSTAPDDPFFADTIDMVLAPLSRISTSTTFRANSHGLPMYTGASNNATMQYEWHRSIGIDYGAQPQTSLSTDGKHLYFASNAPGLSYGYRVKQG